MVQVLDRSFGHNQKGHSTRSGHFDRLKFDNFVARFNNQEDIPSNIKIRKGMK